MFILNANELKKFEKTSASNGKTIHESYLKAKLNLNPRFNDYYFKMRKLQSKETSKCIIESFKDDSLTKLLFIIDMDQVEQIELNEKENIICLKDGTNQQCQIGTRNKEWTNKWLSVLCKSCGFDEVKKSRTLTSSKSSSINSNEPDLAHKASSGPTQSISISSSSSSSSKNLAHTKLQRICSPLKNFFSNAKSKENPTQTYMSSSQNGKPIAATPLIQFLGSIDLCNPKFDSLFNSTQVRQSELHSDDTNYLQLDNFKSGELFEKQKNELLSTRNQLRGKLNSRDQDKTQSDYVNSDALLLSDFQHKLPLDASDVDLFEFDHLIGRNVNNVKSELKPSNRSQLKYVPVEVVQMGLHVDNTVNLSNDRHMNKENHTKSLNLLSNESKSGKKVHPSNDVFFGIENQALPSKGADKTHIEMTKNFYTDLDAMRTDALKNTQLNKY